MSSSTASRSVRATAPAPAFPDARPSTARVRLDYIDWLRILAVALLLPFHSARVFDVFETFYVKNATLSRGLSYLVAFLDVWQMPILFVLAGMSTCLALRWRSGPQYLRERVRRLLVPLAFGVLAIVPPQTYLGLLTHGGHAGSYLEYYPTFFQIHWNDVTGYFGTFTPGHLWFIMFLFVFSAAALPLFLWLRRPRGAGLLARVTAFCGLPGGVFLLVLPLWLTGPLPNLGGRNLFTFILLFVYGYLLAADERLQRSVDAHRWWALAMALLMTAVALVPGVLGVQPAKSSTADIAVFFARTLGAWCWIIALLGLGRRCLTASGPVLRYAREASYPVYILHMTMIAVIAYFVVGWHASVAIKYLAILLAASAATLLVYECLVRRFNPVRFLFGMKPREAAAAPIDGPGRS